MSAFPNFCPPENFQNIRRQEVKETREESLEHWQMEETMDRRNDGVTERGQECKAIEQKMKHSGKTTEKEGMEQGAKEQDGTQAQIPQGQGRTEARERVTFTEQ